MHRTTTYLKRGNSALIRHIVRKRKRSIPRRKIAINLPLVRHEPHLLLVVILVITIL